MDENMRKELRDYAWKYFDRHAEQRLKAFNFYLLLCGAVLAGLFAVLREGATEWLGIVLACILSFISLVFWKLDRRTKFLTKHSEEALKHIEMQMGLPDESGDVPHRCSLFRREKYEQSKCGPDEWSYSTCFALIFALFGLGGLCLAAFITYRINNPTKLSPEPIQVKILKERS